MEPKYNPNIYSERVWETNKQNGGGWALGEAGEDRGQRGAGMTLGDPGVGGEASPDIPLPHHFTLYLLDGQLRLNF